MGDRKRFCRLAGGVLAACLVVSAEAQLRPRQNDTGPGGQPAQVSPPRPGTADRPPTIWLILLAALLGAGVVGTALIPSKRGHQD